MFSTSQVITLQHPVEYYDDEREFPIRLSAMAMTGGVRKHTGYTIPACDPTLAEELRRFRSATYHCSLINLAEAALKFYQDDRFNPHAPLIEYERARFLLLYEWDQIFGINDNGSIAHLSPETSQRHSESLTKPTELIGYGLAVLVLAYVFNLPWVRFRFLSASGKRPDFLASISENDLVETGSVIQFLLDQGRSVFLEVKTRTTSSRTVSNNFPVDLLEDLDRKRVEWIRKTQHRGQFIGVYVAIPKPANWPHGRTEVVLADPGDTAMLSENEQAEFIIREIVSLAYRHGLLHTVREGLSWILELGFDLSDNESQFLKSLDESVRTDKFPTLLRAIDGIEYSGRAFSEVLYALNRPGERGMTKSEAEMRLLTGDLGVNYFCGIDAELQAIIHRRDVTGLLAYGMNRPREPRPQPTGFIRQEEPLKPEEAQDVRAELETALKHW